MAVRLHLPAAGVALATLLALPAPAPADEAGIVVKPRAGAKIAAGPILAEIRASRRARHVFLRLNGRSVTSRLVRSRRRPGRRVARLSASYGLRYGRNLLSARVHEPGKGVRRQTVRFRLRKRRPLPGAGRDVHQALRRKLVLLDGRRSRPRRPPRTARRLRYRWSIVAKPQGSAVRLAQPQSSRPRLRPDRLGRYRVKMRVSDGVRSYPDFLDVTAVPDTPLVPVDTAVEEGPGAVVVGDQTYPFDDLGRGLAGVQLVVLDRKSSALILNQSYVGSVPGLEQLQQDLAGLQDDRLAIVTLWPNGNASLGPAEVAPFNAAVARIGALPYASFNFGNSGTLVSVIGVPGLGPGQGHQSAVKEGQDDGSLIGYLAQDQYNNYRLVNGDYVPFDLGAPAGGSNTITIGDQSYTASLPQDAAGGFQVVTVDRQTLQPISNQAFGTNSSTQQASLTEQGKMQTLVQDTQNNSGLMFVRGIGAPLVRPGTFTESGFGGVETVMALRGATASLLDQFGPTDTYSLVGYSAWRGWAGAGPSGVPEASTPMTRQSSDRLRGVLSRNHQMLFTPHVSDTSGAFGWDLYDIAYQAPTPWPPYNGQAMAYLAAQAGLGSDVRSNYWTQPCNESYWGPAAEAIAAVTYPPSGKGFTAAELSSLKSQLATEIGWVLKVCGYLQDVATPFSSSGTAFQSWADLQQIAVDVQAGVQAPGGAAADADIAGIFPDALEFGEAVTEEASFGVLGALMFIAIDLSSLSDGGEPLGDISSTVAQLGTDLANDLQSVASGSQRLSDAIVADYGKLRTVAQYAYCDSPNCPAGWAWTQDDENEAAVAVEINTKRQLTMGLMPARFYAWGLKGAGYGTFGPIPPTKITNAQTYSCTPGAAYQNQPFKNVSANGQVDLTLGWWSESYLLALGAVDNIFDAEPPSDKLVKPFFDSLDVGGDPTTGGLGLYKPWFFVRTWPVISTLQGCD